MSTDYPQVTPEQAREQLTVTQARSLPSARDRKVHAIGTAVFGVSIAFYMATLNVVSGSGRLLLTGAFIAIGLGEAIWIERTARTVPRRARLWSRLGIGASLVLGLAAVLPWLNLRAQTEPNTWPMVLVAGLVVAVPSLVASALIARGPR